MLRSLGVGHRHPRHPRRGHTQAGDIREIYLNDPANVPPDELITEVLLPVS
jgi:effector-binding domain-containing protein